MVRDGCCGVACRDFVAWTGVQASKTLAQQVIISSVKVVRFLNEKTAGFAAVTRLQNISVSSLQIIVATIRIGSRCDALADVSHSRGRFQYPQSDKPRTLMFLSVQN